MGFDNGINNFRTPNSYMAGPSTPASVGAESSIPNITAMMMMGATTDINNQVVLNSPFGAPSRTFNLNTESPEYQRVAGSMKEFMALMDGFEQEGIKMPMSLA